MKIISKISLSLVLASSLFLATVNAEEVKADGVKSVTEASLGLRKTDLYSEDTETHGAVTKYSDAAAGTSKKIKRAFQDAPPMIPHSVEGLIPITITNNACVGCHMPAVAAAVKATPVPKSHLMDFRPKTNIGKDGRITKDGKAVDNTSSETRANISIKENKEEKLTGARFNCTQCHAPQSDAEAPKNTFEAVYSNKDGATKSSWIGSRMTDNLDTLIK